MAEGLKIDAYDTASGMVLVLTGELDLQSSPGFTEILTRLRRTGVEKLTFDLTGLSFVDSTGLRAILAAKQPCEESSCEFAVKRATPQVHRIFELTHFLERLPLVRGARHAKSSQMTQLWPEPVAEPDREQDSPADGPSRVRSRSRSEGRDLARFERAARESLRTIK